MMINRDDFKNLISNALRNNDNEIRSQSEARLVQLRDSNPNGFFEQCAQLLSEEKSQIFYRQSAGTLLSRSAILKCQPDNKNFHLWDALNIQVKQKVKQAALSTLVSSSIVIVKAGSHVISSIASIEIPRNQWLNVIDVLAENTTNSNPSFREASIIAIGYICQQLHYSHAQVNTQTCQQFLGGIIIGSRDKENKNIVETSLQALRNSLTFLTPLLTEQVIRNQVFNVLLSKMGDEQLSSTAYEGYYQFVKSCYQYLGQYMNKIMEFVVAHIKIRKQITLKALQLIDTIGSEYLDRKQQKHKRTQNYEEIIINHIEPYQNTIIPEIMQCFLIQSQDDLAFSEMRNSASKSLSTIVALGNRSAVDIIIQGVVKVVRSQNIGHRQASALLLATLCEYPSQDKHYAQNYIDNAFEHVIALLGQNQQIVILNTLAGFITISESYPQKFYNRSCTQAVIQKLFSLMSYNEKVEETVLGLFFSISQGFKENDTNILVTQPQLFLTKIVNYYQNCLQNFKQKQQFYDQAANIIIHCLVRTQNRQILNYMVQHLIQKYEYFFCKQNYTKNDHEMIQQSILTVLGTNLLKLQKFLPNLQKIPILCKILENHLNKFGLDAAYLEILGGMVVCYKNGFEKKSENYWRQIMHSLETINNQKLFKAGLAVIGDYSRQYARSFQDKIDQILGRLFFLLNQNIDRKIKISIIYCIGDLILGIGPLAENYIDNILKICDLCFNAVYSFLDNPDQKEYKEQLQNAVVQFYACLSFSLHSSQNRFRPSQKVINYFDRVFEFILKTCENRQKPTIQYLKTSLYLVADQLLFFSQVNELRNMVNQVLSNHQLKQLFNSLKQWEDREQIRHLITHIDYLYQKQMQMY